ncbi:MAG: ABC transporter ATP-binding protein [Alphaproteobacteria bacterium]
MSNSNIVVNLTDVNFAYDDSKTILSNINLNIKQGQIVAFVGESGAGKSTLLHIISGYIKPNSGEAYILGDKITAPTDRCAVMFQDDYLYPWLTVKDNIKLGLKITGKKVSDNYLNGLISALGLDELIDKKPNQLSGGQRQRVAFARSLATAPDILALDEPFSALDPNTTLRLQTLIRKTVKDIKKSLLFVSHSIEEVVRMADKVFILNAGKITDTVEILLNEGERDNKDKTSEYEKQINILLSQSSNDGGEDVQTLYYI